jgi:biopolymer transport protein ExbD
MKLFFPLLIFLLSIDKLAAQNADSGQRIYFKTVLDTPKVPRPTVTSRTVDISNDYIIDLKKDSLSLSFKKAIFQFKSFDGLDKYINLHIQQIRKSEVVIRASSELGYSEFKPMLDLLRKYKLFKFSLITEDR